MKLIRESIFSSVVRSFCIAFFSVIGIMIAVFLVLVLFGLGKGAKTVDSTTFDFVIPETNGRKYAFASHKPILLRIDLEGTIGSTGGITTEEVRSILNESTTGPLKGDKVRGILLYMNSPGGGAVTSESIYYAIKDYALAHQIPVYTYVEGLCASGGYLIACATDKIYASNASMIGSVGTLIMFFNVSDTMNKVGVANWTMSRGKGKTSMNPFQPWGENANAEYIPLLNTNYEQFLSIVTNARPQVSKQQLVEVYGAGIFMADKAQEIGYIDGAGYQLNEVTDMLAEAANLDKNNYQVITMEPKAKFADFLKLDTFSSKSPLSYFQKALLNKDAPLNLEPLYLFNPPTTQ